MNNIKSTTLAVLVTLTMVSPLFALTDGVSLLGNEGTEVTNGNKSKVIKVKKGMGRGLWAQIKAWRKAREANWPSKDEVKAKIKKTGNLTRAEFIIYLRIVEEMNPKMGWQQIITRLHDESYPADSHCVVAGVPLFVNGKDNEGWEKVKLPKGNVPKFVVDGKGQKVDVAHAYAGIRGGLNRTTGVTRWAMTNVNTGWGDSLQVASARIKAAKDYTVGAFTFNYSKSHRAMDKFSAAGNYKPKNQVLGNNMGQAVQKTLRNSPVKLSDAFDIHMN